MQNEKNEDSTSTQTSPHAETVSENQADQRDTSTTSNEKKPSKKLNPKLLYLSLLEASLRYREVYWRDEVEAYGHLLEQQRTEGLNFSKTKAFDRRKKAILLDFESSMEKFNKAAYAEIEGVVKQFSKQGQKAFDEFSTGFALIGEEFIMAEDKHDFLIVCQAYNSGKFKSALEALKQKGESAKELIEINEIKQ